MTSQPNHDQFHRAYETVLHDARGGWCLAEHALPTLPRTGTLQITYAVPDDAENAGTQFALIKRDYGPLDHRPNLPHEAVWLTRAIGDFMNVVIRYDRTAIACFGLRNDCERAHALYRACCACADTRFAEYWSDYRSNHAGIGLEETRRDFMIGFMKGMTEELYAIADVRFAEACRSHPEARVFIERLAAEVMPDGKSMLARPERRTFRADCASCGADRAPSRCTRAMVCSNVSGLSRHASIRKACRIGPAAPTRSMKAAKSSPRSVADLAVHVAHVAPAHLVCPPAVLHALSGTFKCDRQGGTSLDVPAR